MRSKEPGGFRQAPTSEQELPGLLLRTAFSLVIAAVGLLTVASPAHAGSFNVSPVRLYVDGSHKTTMMRLRNEADGPISLQLQAVAWSQDASGADVESPTEDLVFVPKMLTLEKGASRVVRVGLKRFAQADREKTYRIYIRELPAVGADGKNMVKVLLRIGVPVFVAPVRESVVGSIEQLKVADCRVEFDVANTGTVNFHLQEVSLDVRDGDGRKVFNRGEKGWYLLAGQRRAHKLELDEAACAVAQEVRVRVEADKITLDEKVALPAASATPPGSK